MTMTKTQLAKILVFVNLVLSLVFASWALGVYTQRIDWGKKAAAADRPAGELARRLEAIDRLGGGSREGSRQRAEARWSRAHQYLQALERVRDQNQQWYAQQLQVLFTGMIGGKPIVPPVQALVYNQGVLVVDPLPFGRPQLRPVADRAGQPLPALQSLDQEYQKTNKEIESTMKTIAGLIQKERELTVVINGEGPRKGLRRQLAEEQAETDKVLAEQEYLRPLFYNRHAEAQLLQERQKALEDRLKELQGAGKTASRVR